MVMLRTDGTFWSAFTLSNKQFQSVVLRGFLWQEKMEERPTTPRKKEILHILESPYGYNPEWIDSDRKVVAPIPESSILDGNLALRIESGAREVKKATEWPSRRAPLMSGSRKF